MNRGLVSIFKSIAIVFLTFSLLLQGVSAAINVGIKTGDWIRYDYYDQRINATEPNFWLKLTVTSVNGTVVSLHPETNATWLSFTDGHMDIAYDCFAYLPFAPVVPANLSAGDAVPAGTIRVTINDTTQFIGREVAHLVLPGSLGSDEWYWDRDTGLLLAYSTSGGVVSLTVADTILFIPEFSTWPLLLLFMMAVLIAIALRRKKTSFSPEFSKD
jgi:hypothetical protein